MLTQKVKPSFVEIDLDGQQGNAYWLLGYASQIGESIGMSPDERKAIHTEMTSGDYINLVAVFERTFCNYIVMVSSDRKLMRAVEKRLKQINIKRQQHNNLDFPKGKVNYEVPRRLR